MPIANIQVATDQPLDGASLIGRWSTFSEISSDEMTANVIEVEQSGKPYDAMAFLHLSSQWSELEREDLGLGLARALAEALEADPSRIFVATAVVGSGNVVESGEIVRW